jgi:large subunit ribosomal protein L6e
MFFFRFFSLSPRLTNNSYDQQSFYFCVSMVRALKGGKNPELAIGIRKRSTKPMVRKYKPKKPVAKVAPKVKKFQGKDVVVGKNKGVRRFYPTEPRSLRRVTAPKKKAVVAANQAPAAKLRASITPGTVLILLSGQYRGKRVVFLKQLQSGLLLVTGPYKLNGVPLRRVSQAYVIATSTKVDISSITLDAKLNDTFFKSEKAPKKIGPDRFFGIHRPRIQSPLTAERKELQKAVDAAVLKQVQKVELLGAYIKSVFTLKRGQYPHNLKF